MRLAALRSKFQGLAAIKKGGAEREPFSCCYSLWQALAGR